MFSVRSTCKLFLYLHLIKLIKVSIWYDLIVVFWKSYEGLIACLFILCKTPRPFFYREFICEYSMNITAFDECNEFMRSILCTT